MCNVKLLNRLDEIYSLRFCSFVLSSYFLFRWNTYMFENNWLWSAIYAKESVTKYQHVFVAFDPEYQRKHSHWQFYALLKRYIREHILYFPSGWANTMMVLLTAVGCERMPAERIEACRQDSPEYIFYKGYFCASSWISLQFVLGDPRIISQQSHGL